MADFDLLVNIRDEKTGRVVKTNPFRAYQRNGVRLYERPVGSGNLWYENGKEAGRVVLDANGKQEFDTEAEHQTWNPPLTEDQKLQRKYMAQEQRIKILEAELAAARVDQKEKVSPAKTKAKKVWTGEKKGSAEELS